MIRGIGPVMAERIVKKFGKETMEVIDNHLERLAEVEGIGPTRLQMIQQSWNAQKGIRDLMLFLQSHGVSTTYAAKIFKEYGDHAATIIRSNPYRLATDIIGIGFLTADRIAEKLGFDKNSELRAESGIIYMLYQLSTDGHTYYPYEPLIDRCIETLQTSRSTLETALTTLAKKNRIVIERLVDPPDTHGHDQAVYLALYHTSETSIARHLASLMGTPSSLKPLNAAKAVSWAQKRLAITLAERQFEAIAWAVREKVMVITGGPGTGKTTIINAMIMIFSHIEARVLLAAPTGRAAKRMGEATGFEAKTIHRLLEYSVREGGFSKKRT